MQNINIFFCAGQQLNLVATLAVLSIQPFGTPLTEAVAQHFAERLELANRAASP
jgi:hypothetical protein